MKNKMSSLQAQVERIHRHARQGSIGTRREYRKCMLRFVAWLDLNCNLQNMRNINNKHLRIIYSICCIRGTCRAT